MDGPSALKQAQELSTRSFNHTDRRRYFEHLLTLPSYKSPSLNAYYAKNISRDFTEFEDLQDQAVDAVLDLCEDEDEQTRICGVQALAEIGTVEPRWVRGNTGVLLQLLECPPAELRHVKKALFTLLDVSPSEVFSIMAEDCNGTEADTGASRRNILEFLTTDAKAKRKELLESGKYIAAEETFARGFYDVLKTTAIAETRTILGMLLPLSTISGRDSTGSSRGKYAKTVIKCLHPKSSLGLTVPLIKLWDEFVDRADGLDPRWTLAFLADHGGAVVQAAMEKGDKEARSILDYPNTNSSPRFKRYLDDRDRSEPELETRQLVPLFAKTMLDSAIHYATKTTNDTLTTLELIVYGVYTIITLDRHMREYIPKPLSRQLKEFGNLADRNKRNTRDEKAERAWRNLRDMVEIMADRDEKVIDIKPSWTIKVRTRSKSKSQSPVKISSRAPATAPAVVDKAKVDDTARVEPKRQRQTTPPLPEVSRVPAKAGASIQLHASLENSLPQQAANNAQPTKELPPTPIVPTPTAPRTIPVSTPITPAAPAPGLSIRSRATQVTSTGSAPTGSAITNGNSSATNNGSIHTTLPSAAAGMSILARAKQTPTTSPAPVPVPVQAPVQTPQGLSIRAAAAAVPKPLPAATTTTTESPRPPSLLSRMSATNVATNNKRSRDETTTTTTPVPIEKKAKPAPAPAPAPSLLSRMGSLGSNQSPASVVGAPAPTGTPAAGMSIRRAGGSLPPNPMAPANGFSIKNRATSASTITNHPQPTSTLTPIASPAGGFRIRRNLSDAPAPVAAPAVQPRAMVEVDDTPVIRKGRGFASQSDQLGNDLLLTPPITTPAAVEGFRKPASLANRLGARIHRLG